jgi:hypothetical protein
MDLQEAIAIMRALATGTDPETGKAFDSENIYRRPKVVKVLNRALGALVKEEERERFKPQNAGRYWSRQEIAKICEEVQEGMDFHEIAKRHNRSVGSIVARLIKLGKIKPPSERTA